MTYGSDVFAMTFGDPEGRSDPMNVVFPKVMMVVILVILVMVVMTTTKTVMIIIIDQVTKCTFHKYGPSGTVTRHDGLCILALNIINEKVIIINIIMHIIFNHCCHNPDITPCLDNDQLCLRSMSSSGSGLWAWQSCPDLQLFTEWLSYSSLRSGIFDHHHDSYHVRQLMQ